MRFSIQDMMPAVLAHTGWNQGKLASFLGCGKNSLKSWQERGAPYYIILALERIMETKQ